MEREIHQKACLDEATIRACLLQPGHAPTVGAHQDRHLSNCPRCRSRLKQMLDRAMAHACLGMDSLDWEAFVAYRLHRRPARWVAKDLGLTMAHVVVASTKALLAIRLQLETRHPH